MSIERMERFERIWSIQHAVPVETLPAMRWRERDGYRDPAMAAHYRTFNLALDSIMAAMPPELAEAIAAAGVKIA